MLRQIMFPLTVGLVSILVLGLAEIILLRTLNREWWNIKWVRRSAILLPIFGCLMLALWVVGEMYTKDWLLFPGMVLSILCLILEFCLMISLPLSGFVHFIQWLVDRFSKSRRKPGTDKPDQGRRFIIQAAAAALPVAALPAGWRVSLRPSRRSRFIEFQFILRVSPPPWKA